MKLIFFQFFPIFLFFNFSNAVYQYPYQTVQSFSAPSRNLNPNQMQIQMPPRISSNTFMSELSEKIKSLKFDKINPSPIIINGGNLAPLHIYHQPMWLPSIVRNTNDEYKELLDLEMMNKKIDQEIKIRDPYYKKLNDSEIFQQKIIIGDVNHNGIPRQQLFAQGNNGGVGDYNHQKPINDIQRQIIGQDKQDINGFNGLKGLSSLKSLNEINGLNSLNDLNSFSGLNRINDLSDLNGYGDINKNIQNEIVNHEINGKSSNYYEATSPKTFLPNFKETIIDNSNNNQTSINNMDTKNVISMVDSPKCLTKKGFIKIREKDVLEKEVPNMYAILTKDRLTYFLDQQDQSTIQGSIELKIVNTPLNLIKGTKNCFQLNTHNEIQDCSICAENEKEMSEWLTVLSQNIINCN